LSTIEYRSEPLRTIENRCEPFGTDLESTSLWAAFALGFGGLGFGICISASGLLAPGSRLLSSFAKERPGAVSAPSVLSPRVHVCARKRFPMAGARTVNPGRGGRRKSRRNRIPPGGSFTYARANAFASRAPGEKVGCCAMQPRYSCRASSTHQELHSPSGKSGPRFWDRLLSV